MVEESIVFGTQKNKRYSLLNNIFYNFKAEWEWDKKMFVFQWLVILPNVTAAFLGTLLPAEVIRGLEEGWPPQQLAGRIALLATVPEIHRKLCRKGHPDLPDGRLVYRKKQSGSEGNG